MDKLSSYVFTMFMMITNNENKTGRSKLAMKISENNTEYNENNKLNELKVFLLRLLSSGARLLFSVIIFCFVNFRG